MPTKKLNDEQVQAIRRLYVKFGYTHQEIADKFDITRQCVTRIVTGKSWVHLPLEHDIVMPPARVVKKRLTTDQVRLVRGLAKAGVKHSVIGMRVGRLEDTVTKIVNGYTYQDVL